MRQRGGIRIFLIATDVESRCLYEADNSTLHYDLSQKQNTAPYCPLPPGCRQPDHSLAYLPHSMRINLPSPPYIPLRTRLEQLFPFFKSFTLIATAEYTRTGLGVLHGFTDISSTLQGGLENDHSQY